MNELEIIIEELRERLNELVLYRKLTNEEVIVCSQKLDILLVKYEKNKKYYIHRY